MKKSIILASSLLLLNVGCNKKTESTEPTLRYAKGDAFGSTYGIQYYSDKDLSDEIVKALTFFDDKISTYKSGTDVERFNQSEKGTAVDSIVIDLWKQCQDFNQKTDGYFDPTVQPLSNLYGFKKAKIHNKPSRAQVDSVMQFVGIAKTAVRNDSILKNDTRTELVFNAITGYINDYVAHILDQAGVKSYLVEIGGEIRAKGKKEDGNTWVVGVDVPKSGDQDLFTTVPLDNESLATSGNYRKFHILDNGDKVVHTMNPIDGTSGISNLLSATVIAPTAAEADATATALMAMGLDKAKAYAQNRKDLKFLLIWTDDKGEFQSEKFNNF
ncbi:FAD:protein FMN transferase [Ornithobacterium rhinotracheale]|uniref:FAD:protein FMN transferase n=1 Tax=Ornithobacterium rhinotracheale TaxID=28251 RepID=UPI004036B6E1